MNAPKPAFDLVLGMDRSDRKVNLYQLDLLAHQEHASVLSTDPAALQTGRRTCVNATPPIGWPSSSNNRPTTSSVS